MRTAIYVWVMGISFAMALPVANGAEPSPSEEASSEEALKREEFSQPEESASRLFRRINLLESNLNLLAAFSPAPSSPDDVKLPPLVKQFPVNLPPLVLDGYCPVSLVESKLWSRGSPQWAAMHRGRTYMFVGEAEQQSFLKDPDKYAPLFSGDDVVVLVDDQKQVPGRREHGVFYNGKVYLFANEASLRKFAQDPVRYAQVAFIAYQGQIGTKNPIDKRENRDSNATDTQTADNHQPMKQRALSFHNTRPKHCQVPDRNECAKQRLAFDGRTSAVLVR